MRSLIQQLRTLNELDTRLAVIRRDLERLPRELAEREEDVRLQGETIERRRAEVMRTKSEADALDVELKAGEEALKRLLAHMNQMRSTRELETVRRQMETQRGWNRDSEEKGLTALEQAELKERELNLLKARLASAQAALAEDRVRLGREMAELAAQRDRLLKDRAAQTAEIPAEELAVYDRIVVNRGQAVAAVSAEGVCLSCRMKLPPQTHNLALAQKELITCPSCGRILTPQTEENERGRP